MAKKARRTQADVQAVDKVVSRVYTPNARNADNRDKINKKLKAKGLAPIVNWGSFMKRYLRRRSGSTASSAPKTKKIVLKPLVEKIAGVKGVSALAICIACYMQARLGKVKGKLLRKFMGYRTHQPLKAMCDDALRLQRWRLKFGSQEGKHVTLKEIFRMAQLHGVGPPHYTFLDHVPDASLGRALAIQGRMRDNALAACCQSHGFDLSDGDGSFRERFRATWCAVAGRASEVTTEMIPLTAADPYVVGSRLLEVLENPAFRRYEALASRLRTAPPTTDELEAAAAQVPTFGPFLAGCISEAAARFLPDYEAERCSKIGTGRRTNLLLREFANPRDQLQQLHDLTARVRELMPIDALPGIRRAQRAVCKLHQVLEVVLTGELRNLRRVRECPK